MTKAEHIRDLDDGRRTTRQIAEIVGCLSAYVRVVLRQRANGDCIANKNYRLFNRDKVNAWKRERYRRDEDFRLRKNAADREYKRRKRAEAMPA